MINKRIQIPENFLFINNVNKFEIIEKQLGIGDFFFNLMFNLNDFNETSIGLRLNTN
jgi:hypothetical protein